MPCCTKRLSRRLVIGYPCVTRYHAVVSCQLAPDVCWARFFQTEHSHRCGCLEAECFGEIDVQADVRDLFVFDYESGILGKFASAGDLEVGCYGVGVTLVGVFFCSCSNWDGDAVDICPVFFEVGCHCRYRCLLTDFGVKLSMAGKIKMWRILRR
jgi:hypothetical protein